MRGNDRSGVPFRLLRLREPYQPAIDADRRAVNALRSSDPDAMALLERHLGGHGRLISSSKTRYSRRYRTHLVVFNANVLAHGRKLWWGDLDLTLDEPKLRAAALELAAELHVLYEHDGRFRGRDDKPLVENYVYWTNGRERRVGPLVSGEYEVRAGSPRRKRP